MTSSWCFALALRIPAWSEETALTVNGQAVAVTKGYTQIERTWSAGDTVELLLDMRTQVVRPIAYGTQILTNRPCWKANYIATTFDIEHPDAGEYIALQRRPVVLAQDARLGCSLNAPAPVRITPDGCVDVTLEENAASFAHLVCAQVPLENGETMTLVDYGSAGKTWSEDSQIAAWIRIS